MRDVSMGCMDTSHSLAVLFEHEEKYLFCLNSESKSLMELSYSLP